MPLIAVPLLDAQIAFDAPARFLGTAGSPSRVLYAHAGGYFKSTDAGATWTPMYLTAPGVAQPPANAFLIDPANESNLYAGTTLAGGGVWRSTDAGATWAMANAGLPTGEGEVGYMFLVPSAPRTVYAKIGNRLFKSTDGATSWRQQSTLPGAGRVFAIHPTNPARMFFVDGERVFLSTDEGGSWNTQGTLQLFGSSLTNAVNIALDPSDQATVYIGVRGAQISSGGVNVVGVHRSTDGGATFRNIRSAQPSFLVVDPVGRPNIYYSTVEGLDLCRSTDRGSNWECTRPGEIAGTGGINPFVDPRAPDNVWGGMGGGRDLTSGIVRSTNAGQVLNFVPGTVRPTLGRPDPVTLTAVEGDRVTVQRAVATLEVARWALPFTVTPSETSWLSVTPPGGTTPANLAITVDTAGLAPGAYRSSIRLSSEAAFNGAVDLAIEVTVNRAVGGGPQYTISTAAGTGSATYSGVPGPATSTGLGAVSGIGFDASGNLYLTHDTIDRVTRLSPDGQLTAFAGTGTGGLSRDNGPATAAQLDSPADAVADAQGNVFIADRSNRRLRRVSNNVITTAVDTGSNLIGTTFLIGPSAVALDPQSRIWFLDGTRVLRYLSQNNASVLTVRGLTPGISGASGLAIDGTGNVLVAETLNHRVVLITPAGDGRVIAGGNGAGFSGDGGLATSAALNRPSGVAVDAGNNIYIADESNHRVRMITPDGVIRTIAGTGSSGFQGDSGPATMARLSFPADVAVDREGNVFVADRGNRRIRKLTRVRVAPPQVSGDAFVVPGANRGPLSPGSLFTAYGVDLATQSEIFSGAPWPTSLGGATVTIDNRRSPLFFSHPSQINGQVPFETQIGRATATFSVDGTTGSTITFEVVPASPGILVHGDQAVAVNADGSLNGPGNGAAPGSAIVVYLTGIGTLDNAVATGAAAAAEPLSRAALPFSATIGDAEVTVLFLGLTPGFVGLAQANLVVPNLPPGDYRLIIIINGVASNGPIVTIR